MQDLHQDPLPADQEKWRNWTMAPKKRQPNVAVITSAIVLMTATLLLMPGLGV
ncbi:MAG: hypothetical protein AAFQ58_09665 [Pseudomonadota bacterium]